MGVDPKFTGINGVGLTGQQIRAIWRANEPLAEATHNWWLRTKETYWPSGDMAACAAGEKVARRLPALSRTTAELPRVMSKYRSSDDQLSKAASGPLGLSRLLLPATTSVSHTAPSPSCTAKDLPVGLTDIAKFSCSNPSPARAVEAIKSKTKNE